MPRATCTCKCELQQPLQPSWEQCIRCQVAGDCCVLRSNCEWRGMQRADYAQRTSKLHQAPVQQHSSTLALPCNATPMQCTNLLARTCKQVTLSRPLSSILGPRGRCLALGPQ